MKATWQPTGAAEPVTLGDDAAKHSIYLETLGGQAVVQVTPLFRGANPFTAPRGNVMGDVVFSAAKSHATQAAAVAYFKSEHARLNGEGSLVLTEAATTMTFAGAKLKAVQAVGITGLRWTIRYSFAVTTMT